MRHLLGQFVTLAVLLLPMWLFFAWYVSVVSVKLVIALTTYLLDHLALSCPCHYPQYVIALD